jgi:hypothetical protein
MNPDLAAIYESYGGLQMSLTVTAEDVHDAVQHNLSIAKFIGIVEGSLPRAWTIITDLIARKARGESGLIEHAPAHMEEETRGQLLRMLASNAIRTAIEIHFGVRLAFRNCHAVALFDPGDTEEFAQWTSLEAQVINQSPDQVDC